jgi:hypothetical protein
MSKRASIKLHQFKGNPNATLTVYNAFSDFIPTSEYSDGINTTPDQTQLDTGRWKQLGSTMEAWDRWMSLLSNAIRDGTSGFPKDLPTIRQELSLILDKKQKPTTNVPHICGIRAQKITLDKIDKDLLTHLKDRPSAVHYPHSAIPTPDMSDLPKTKMNYILPALQKLPKGYSLWMKKIEKKDKKVEQAEEQNEEGTSSTKRERSDIILYGHPAKIIIKSAVEVVPHLLWLYLAEDAWLNGYPKPENVTEEAWQKDPRSQPGKNFTDWEFDRTLCPCPGCVSMNKKVAKTSAEKPVKKDRSVKIAIAAPPTRRPRVHGLVPKKSTAIPGKIANVHVGEGLVTGDELWWDSEHEWENVPKTVCTFAFEANFFQEDSQASSLCHERVGFDAL